MGSSAHRRLILIGQGLIGSAISRAATGRGQVVVPLIASRSKGGSHGDLRDSLRTVLRDGDVVIAAHGPALPRASTEELPELINAFAAPATQIVELLDSHSNMCCIWFSSGGAVYGPSSSPVNEFASLAPQSPYGVAKVAEELIFGLARSGTNRSIGLRCSTVFGPRPQARPNQGLVQLAVQRMLRNESVMLFGQGKARRGYLASEDLAQVVLRLVDAEPDQDIYNVCSGQVMSSLEVVDRVARVMGHKASVEFVDRVDQDVVLDASRLRSEFPGLTFSDFSERVAAIWR